MGLFESIKKLLKQGKNEEKPKVPASNFTPRAQQVLALAKKESDRFNHNYLGTEHLLLGLIKLDRGVAVNVLQGIGIDLQALSEAVEKQIGTGPNEKMTGNAPYTPRVKKVLDMARREAKDLNHTYIGTEHLLLGLLREGGGVGAKVLRDFDVNLEQLRAAVLKELDPNYVPSKDPQTIRNESIKKFFEPKQGEQFTPLAIHALSFASQEAKQLNLNYLGTEHLLFGLIKLGNDFALIMNILKSHGMNLENVRVEVEKAARDSSPDDKIQTSGRIPYTPRMKNIILLSKHAAKALNHTYVGTEHLLLGLLREKEGPAAQIFKTFNVDMEQLRTSILKELDPNFDK